MRERDTCKKIKRKGTALKKMEERETLYSKKWKRGKLKKRKVVETYIIFPYTLNHGLY
jgi:hypothetical protein